MVLKKQMENAKGFAKISGFINGQPHD